MEDIIKDRLFRQFLKSLISLFFGLILYSLGILATLYSRLGMSPWDVFHMGIVKHTSLSLGHVSQITGLIILLITYFMGIIPGLGSILNMIFIGVFIDIINLMECFKTPVTILGRITMIFIGILIIGWATFFYLRAGLGAGPRDGLMEALVKRTDKPVWVIRGGIEITVLVLGYFLGGPVGIGTLITAFSIGFSVQFAFKIGKYSSKDVEHKNIVELYNKLKMNNKSTSDKSIV